MSRDGAVLGRNGWGYGALAGMELLCGRWLSWGPVPARHGLSLSPAAVEVAGAGPGAEGCGEVGEKALNLYKFPILFLYSL